MTDLEKNNGKLKRWSLARCQNVEYIRRLWADKDMRVEHLEDVNLTLCKTEYLLALIKMASEHEKTDRAINYNPELKRDLKITLAKMEYDKSISEENKGE